MNIDRMMLIHYENSYYLKSKYFELINYE